MQLNQKEIEALIPHSGAMSLLNEVLKWDEDHIICLANSHRSKHNPLRNENALSSVCGVEYAAQAMAVHGALSTGDQMRNRAPDIWHPLRTWTFWFLAWMILSRIW